MARGFSGDPALTWLNDPNGPDRNMSLTADFWFEDSNGVRWSAAARYQTDGASIPRALWTLVGSPFTGDYRRAAIVHDKACDDAGSDSQKRRAADRMFYDACRAGGCSVRDAMVLYVGVRIGAVWPLIPQWTNAAADGRPRLTRTSGDVRLEQDFKATADQVLAGGETDDIHELEQRTDAALTFTTGLNLLGR